MSVLVLGGSGFVGRNLVEFLVQQQDVSMVRVVDKRSWDSKVSTCLSGEHKAGFQNEKVDFKKLDLRSPEAAKLAFEGGFDFVVNLADDTNDDCNDEEYQVQLLEVTKNAITAAKLTPPKCFVELSTTTVYDPDKKKPCTEKFKTVPFTTKGKYKLMAEELVITSGLTYTIFRLPFVYGPGCTQGIMSRVVVGKVYQELGKTMKMLWKGSHYINTVHVYDVCSAIYNVMRSKKITSFIYNLADSGNTDQEKIAEILREIYGIETGYQTEVKNKVAKKFLKDVAKVANDKHWGPWKDLLERNDIANSPLSPYISKELLRDIPLHVDGSLAERSIAGFKYEYPCITVEEVKRMIDYYHSQGVFPQ